jgi:GMP synthase-like glutamine amidotransferase
MRVLVVQNYDGTGLGQIATALSEAGAEIVTIRAHHGEAFQPDARDHDALVVLGGAQNALDDAAHGYFPALLDTMRDFAHSGRAVLGVCLGAQLLARALGGQNLIGAAPEFGWTAVDLTPDGRADPLLADLDARFTTFQWHDDTFTLPPGALHLARNAAAEIQGFRFGRAAYGIQFHFEADRPLVAEWSIAFAPYLAERQPHWADAHAREAAAHGPEADRAGLAVARAWVARIAR